MGKTNAHKTDLWLIGYVESLCCICQPPLHFGVGMVGGPIHRGSKRPLAITALISAVVEQVGNRNRISSDRLPAARVRMRKQRILTGVLT